MSKTNNCQESPVSEGTPDTPEARPDGLEFRTVSAAAPFGCISATDGGAFTELAECFTNCAPPGNADLQIAFGPANDGAPERYDVPGSLPGVGSGLSRRWKEPIWRSTFPECLAFSPMSGPLAHPCAPSFIGKGSRGGTSCLRRGCLRPDNLELEDVLGNYMARAVND